MINIAGKILSAKRILTITIIGGIILAFLGACKGGGKILGSGNPELMYSAALKFYKAEKWSRASSLFDACYGYYVGSEREDSIAFFSARSKFKHRDYHDCSMLLDEFRRRFGRSIFIEDAEAMYAMCKYYLSPDPTRDQTNTAQAIVAFTEFLERYPNSERKDAFMNIIQELTQRLHDKNFMNAYTYYKIQRYKSAIIAFKNALKNYGETTHREEIMYYIVASSYQFARNSIAEKQNDRYMNTLDAYYTFIAEYPESSFRKELDKYAKEAKDYIDRNKVEKE